MTLTCAAGVAENLGLPVVSLPPSHTRMRFVLRCALRGQKRVEVIKNAQAPGEEFCCVPGTGRHNRQLLPLGQHSPGGEAQICRTIAQGDLFASTTDLLRNQEIGRLHHVNAHCLMQRPALLARDIRDIHANPEQSPHLCAPKLLPKRHGHRATASKYATRLATEQAWRGRKRFAGLGVVQAPFPDPPQVGGGGGRGSRDGSPKQAPGGSPGGTPTYTAQNEPHDAPIL